MRAWGVFMTGMLVAGVAEGAELLSQTTLTGSWDSNANSGSSDQGSSSSDQASSSSDGRVDAGVALEVGSDPGGDVPWRLRYSPGYQMFVSNQGLDSWRHRASGSFEYPFSRATTFSANGDFTRAIRSTLVSDVTESPDRLELQETDEQIDIGSLGIGLSHRLSPRWGATANARYGFTNYHQADRSDFESAMAGAILTYRVTSRQSLGGGISLSRQVVLEADVQTAQGDIETSSEQETRFASVFGSWDYKLNSLWSVYMRAGPTFIDSDLQNQSTEPVLGLNVPTSRGRPLDARSCPRIFEGPTFEQTGEAYVVAPSCGTLSGLVVGGSPIEYSFSNPEELENQGGSNTLFGGFGISRRGERTRFSLSYNRSASENFGGRTSTVADVLSSSLNWEPAPRWNVDARASYSVQTQATEAFLPSLVVVPNDGAIPGLPDDVAIGGVPGGTGEIRAIADDNALDVESWVVAIRATRRLTRRLSGSLTASYYDQRNRSPLEDVSVLRDLNRFDIGVGLTYVFDPIRL
jgi:hypothetical protein